MAQNASFWSQAYIWQQAQKANAAVANFTQHKRTDPDAQNYPLITKKLLSQGKDTVVKV